MIATSSRGTPSPTRTFALPDLGEGLTDAELVSWRVSVGDAVAVDDIVADVETAKATVELPSPHAGRVAELHAAPGDTVPVGAPLVSFYAADSSATTSDDAPDDNASASAGSGAVLVGYGTGTPTSSRRRRRPPTRPDAAPASIAPRVISPVVRRLAHDRGVDLTSLTGSGRAGVIVRRDIEAAARTSPAATQDAARPRQDIARPGRKILRGAHRVAAEVFTRSRREIPDATTWVDVDATEFVAARDALRAAAPDAPIGLLALLARVTVAGLARFPALNSSVESDGADLVVVGHEHVNLGFAAQTEHGLTVPVIRDAQDATTAELAAEIADLTGRARAGRLSPAQLTGGTFTLNNYGVFGVDGSTPIINHPEAALLGVGRIVDKPWVVDGALAVRKVTQLSLSFDHRVCDGGVAGGFLRYVADCVEHPVSLLADL